MYILACVLAVIVYFSGLPQALHEANRVHLENARRPDAGVSFIFGLLATIGIWCLAAWLLERHLNIPNPQVMLVCFSLLLTLWTLLSAIRSKKRYEKYLDSRYIDPDWPCFINSLFATKSWIHPNGEERVFLITRDDANYMIDHECFSTDNYENYWIPCGIGSLYESEEIAVKEAMIEHSWMADVKPKIRIKPPKDIFQ